MNGINASRPRGGAAAVLFALAACALGAGPESARAQAQEEALAAFCGGEPGSGGGAHFTGTVTNSVTGALLPGARVEVAAAGAPPDQPLAFAHSDVWGVYRFCNVAAAGSAAAPRAAADLQLRVSFGANASGPLAVPAEGANVVDLAIAITEPVTILGTVVDRSTGGPIQGAWVALAGTRFGMATNVDGKFSFVGVEPRGHVMEINQLGYAFRSDSVTFLSNALALRIPLAPEAVALDPIVVEAEREPEGDPFFNNPGRRIRGMNPAQMDSIRHQVSDMGDVMRAARLPVQIREIYAPNTALRIGFCVESNRARRRNPSQCNSVAIVVDGMPISSPEYFIESLSPNTVSHFEFVSALEASARYGALAANGVLLIYTRR